MREDAEARSKEVKRLEAEVWDLRRDVGEGRSASRDLPYMMACAFQDYWWDHPPCLYLHLLPLTCSTPNTASSLRSEAGTTITYDYLLSDYNNANRPGGGDGVLDTSTGNFTTHLLTILHHLPGKFTCLTPGFYSVTYSGHALLHPEEAVR